MILPRVSPPLGAFHFNSTFISMTVYQHRVTFFYRKKWWNPFVYVGSCGYGATWLEEVHASQSEEVRNAIKKKFNYHSVVVHTIQFLRVEQVANPNPEEDKPF